MVKARMDTHTHTNKPIEAIERFKQKQTAFSLFKSIQVSVSMRIEQSSEAKPFKRWLIVSESFYTLKWKQLFVFALLHN